MSDDSVTAAEALAELVEARDRASARVDELAAEQRAAVVAREAARTALIEAEREGAGDAQRAKLEKELARAEARAVEPWVERVEGARQAGRDRQAAVQAFAAEHLGELIRGMEQDGEVAAAKVNEAAEAVAAAFQGARADRRQDRGTLLDGRSSTSRRRGQLLEGRSSRAGGVRVARRRRRGSTDAAARSRAAARRTGGRGERGMSDDPRELVAAEHGLDAQAAAFLSGTTLDELEASASKLAKLIGERESEEPPVARGFDLFASARAAKVDRQQKLAALFCGRLEQARDERGRFVSSGFDGGAQQQPVRPEPETHDQTLTRLFHTGEANAGRRLL